MNSFEKNIIIVALGFGSVFFASDIAKSQQYLQDWQKRKDSLMARIDYYKDNPEALEKFNLELRLIEHMQRFHLDIIHKGSAAATGVATSAVQKPEKSAKELP